LHKLQSHELISHQKREGGGRKRYSSVAVNWAKKLMGCESKGTPLVRWGKLKREVSVEEPGGAKTVMLPLKVLCGKSLIIPSTQGVPRITFWRGNEGFSSISSLRTAVEGRGNNVYLGYIALGMVIRSVSKSDRVRGKCLNGEDTIQRRPCNCWCSGLKGEGGF